jgi:uncharacterized damage-inducible protein DinB
MMGYYFISKSVAQLPLENVIDRLISEQMATQHIPGLALAVTQGDKILYAKGYAVASSSQPVTVQMQLFTITLLRTLNHIIHVDETIYYFIHTKNLSKFDPNFIPYPEYGELKSARFEFDDKLIQESQGCSQDWLDEIFEVWSERLNRNRRLPRAFYYIQLFNHQTHHRSQITSELHKMGIDYGNTDLPYNPYYEF